MVHGFFQRKFLGLAFGTNFLGVFKPFLPEGAVVNMETLRNGKALGNYFPAFGSRRGKENVVILRNVQLLFQVGNRGPHEVHKRFGTVRYGHNAGVVGIGKVLAHFRVNFRRTGIKIKQHG